MARPVVAVTIGHRHYARLFSDEAWAALAAFAEIIHHPGDEPAAKPDLLALLPPAHACLTSWDVAPLDADVLAAAPHLRAMAHMGGSVQRFVSEAVWQRRLHVTSAAPALARDVAETTVGLMIVGLKRVWPLAEFVRQGGWRPATTDAQRWPARERRRWPARELHRKQVGIVAASNVGRHVIELLRPFGPSILLYDPFLSSAQAAALGAEKVELDELCQRADVISLHAPAKPATHHLLDARRLALIKDDALLINTARGSLIDEAALIAELSQGRFFAFLDVTDPEPPAVDSPLRTLANVVVLPHIAGCIEDCTPLGDLAVEELRRFFAGEPAIYPIRPEMFERIS